MTYRPMTAADAERIMRGDAIGNAVAAAILGVLLLCFALSIIPHGSGPS